MPRLNQEENTMRNSLLILFVLMLSACSTGPKYIEKSVLVDRPAPVFPEIQPVEQYDFKWIVITKETFESKIKEVEATGGQVVFFALTPEGYQNLSLSIAELRRYIAQQQSVVAGYKSYMESPKEEPKSSEWKLW